MYDKIITIIFIVGSIAAMIALINLLSYTHRYDTTLKIECESKGGTFVQARDPMYICVKTIKLSK